MNPLKISIMAFISLTLLGCSEPAPKEVIKPLVDVYTVPYNSKENIQNLPAVVKASDFTELSFRVNGELIDIAVKSGETVKKGQLLAKLDPTNFQLAVNDKKSKSQLAKKSKERSAKMVKLGNMAQSVLDELDARYRVLNAEYEYAKLQLGYVELRAPFDGVIATVPVENYQSTAIGQTVLTMHRKDMVDIEVSLPDFILSSAPNKADKSSYVFDVLLDSYPDHIFKAQYKKHTTEQTAENKKYVLTLEMPVDDKYTILEGMPGNIKLDMAKLKLKRVITYKVPIEAVLLPDYIDSDSHERVVWRLLPDNTVEPVFVKVQSMANLSFMNVSGDLKEGDKIITQGMIYLAQGMEVKIKKDGALAE